MDAVTTPVKSGTDTATELISRLEPLTSAETMPQGDNIVSPADGPSTASRPEMESTPLTGSSDNSRSSLFSSQSNSSVRSVETPYTPPSAEDARPKGRNLMPCAANSKQNCSERLFRGTRSQNSHENKNEDQRPSTSPHKGKDEESRSCDSVDNSGFFFRNMTHGSPSFDKSTRMNLKRGDVKIENRKWDIHSHSEVPEASDEESNATDSCSEIENISKEEANDTSYKPTGKRPRVFLSTRKTRSSEGNVDGSSTSHPASLSEDAQPHLFDANVATDLTVEPDFVARETDSGAEESGANVATDSTVEPDFEARETNSGAEESDANVATDLTVEPDFEGRETDRDTAAAESEEPSKTSSKPADDAAKAAHIRFEQYEETKSPNDIKIAILNVILQEENKPIIDKEKGFVYMYKLDSSEGHVKIGKSKLGHGLRVKQWANNCKLPFERISDPDDKRFLHYGIVEKLVHTELSNSRKTYQCGTCKKNAKVDHAEWFKVEEPDALEVVERWRGWLVRQQPYGKDGVLRGIWIWKHRKLSEATTDDFKEWPILMWYDWAEYVWYRVDNYLDEELPTMLRSSLFINAVLVFVTRLWCVSNAFLSSIFTIVILAMVLKYS
ncbi:hypothetical protein VE02_00678 [Pseudogymnoascus sp. 03VT05]|nr:hypothetical protein VE02_00678 [Pseudogymnoascus sp. 03VT05]